MVVFFLNTVYIWMYFVHFHGGNRQWLTVCISLLLESVAIFYNRFCLLFVSCDCWRCL